MSSRSRSNDCTTLTARRFLVEVHVSLYLGLYIKAQTQKQLNVFVVPTTIRKLLNVAMCPYMLEAMCHLLKGNIDTIA